MFFGLSVYLIQGIIDFFVVNVLNRLEERSHQCDVAILLHHLDELGEIQLLLDAPQQLVQLFRLLLQVKGDCLEAEVLVGDLLQETD